MLSTNVLGLVLDEHHLAGVPYTCSLAPATASHALDAQVSPDVAYNDIQ